MNTDVILEIAKLAAERAGSEEVTRAAYANCLIEGDSTRRDEPLELTLQLGQRIQALSADEADELVALALLGRGDGATFLELLLDVHRQRHPKPAWWAEQPLLHHYLASGLHRLGGAGWKVLASRPEMLGWLAPGDPSRALPAAPEVHPEAFQALLMEFSTVFDSTQLDHPLQAYASYVHRQLGICDDLDYYGVDEYFEFLSTGHSQRQYAVVCILGDIAIGSAYCFTGNNDAAAKRLDHARTCLDGLVGILERGPEVLRRASLGGQARARRTEPLKQEFARRLELGRADAKWKSMEAAVDAVLEELQAFNNSLKPRPLISEQMASTLRRWLSKDASIRRAYFGESSVEEQWGPLD